MRQIAGAILLLGACAGPAKDADVGDTPDTELPDTDATPDSDGTPDTDEADDTDLPTDTAHTDPPHDTGSPQDSAPITPTADTSQPETYDNTFLWSPLLLTGAPDHGWVPTWTAPPPPGPLSFTDVAASAGLGSTLGNTHGVGVAFVDLNGDDWPDVFTASGINNTRSADSALFLNNGDGTFRDASDGVDALDGVDTLSVTALDYDADGDLDLYVGAHPTSILLANDGTGQFTDVTTAANAGGPISQTLFNASKLVASGDWDGDGDLDIAMISGQLLQRTERGALLRNNGDGTFTDVTAATDYLGPYGNACALMWSDYDNDGDADLFAWGDLGGRGNRVLLDNQGSTFDEVHSQAGLRQVHDHPMGIDSADIDRNGHLDYFVSNIGSHALFLNQGGAFLDAAQAAGVQGGSSDDDFGWGLGFEDLDHDGWWDLFVAYEDDRPHALFRHEGLSPSGLPIYSRSALPQTVRFELFAHARPTAFADFDHDGRTDILVATTDGSRVQLWHNQTDTTGHHWLHVRIPDDGRGAVGGISARVVVAVGDEVWFRDLHGSKSRASQSELTVRFGLGGWDGVDWVAALWPDGRQTVVRGVQADQRLELPPP